MTNIRIGLIEWSTWRYVALLPMTRNYDMRALLSWRLRDYDWRVDVLWMRREGLR